MNELTLAELRDAQQKIIDYKKQVESIISYRDERGRKLIKPEHFLSGEIAAYKFLNSWEKRMLNGEDFLDAKALELLNDIEHLLYWSEQDFSDIETIQGYEEFSMSIWVELMTEKASDAQSDFNFELVKIAAVAEALRGTSEKENDFLHVAYEDLLDGLFMGYTYSVAHEWLMSLPREKYVEIIEGSELHKFHFHTLS